MAMLRMRILMEMAKNRKMITCGLRMVQMEDADETRDHDVFDRLGDDDEEQYSSLAQRAAYFFGAKTCCQLLRSSEG